MADSPLDRHVGQARDLQERLFAERHGVPFLVYRTAGDRQVIVELSPDRRRVLVGRLPTCDVVLDEDPSVSRVHAELERVGDEWLVVDDGLSRNGTFVGGKRIAGRRRLADEDVITVGATRIAFRRPGAHGAITTRRLDSGASPPLTPAQRRVLVALCRPFAATAVAVPASNRRIAEELIVTPDTVKRTLRSLFVAFGVDDRPQNEKRAALALKALETGAVGRHEL